MRLKGSNHQRKKRYDNDLLSVLRLLLVHEKTPIAVNNAEQPKVEQKDEQEARRQRVRREAVALFDVLQPDVKDKVLDAKFSHICVSVNLKQERDQGIEDLCEVLELAYEYPDDPQYTDLLIAAQKMASSQKKVCFT